MAAHFSEEDDEALQKELKEAFRLYDKEGRKKSDGGQVHFSGLIENPWVYWSISGNGYIPTSSLREILAALDDQLTGDQLNEMIAEIDTDSSGTVDFDGECLSVLVCI